MQNSYRLTDRGKILVAIVIALLVFLLPAGILLFSAMADKPPDNEDLEPSGASPPSVVVTHPTQTTVSPPPNGGGFSPPEATGGPEATDRPGEDGSADSKAPDKPPGSSPIGGNPSDGTLSFLFSTNQQDALDEDTALLLGEFLSFAGNTENSRIAVELPHLSEDAENTIISVIVNAFAARGVPENRLAFVINPESTAEGSFMVHLSYIPHETK